MALHPGERKRHLPEEAPVVWDPIRRALEENQDWYRDLVEHSQDVLCVHDLEGRFLSLNSVSARLLGYSVEELMGKPIRDFVDPQFHTRFDAYLREIESAGETRGLMGMVTRSGEKWTLEYHSTLRAEGVAAPIVRVIAHDVTERVRTKRALRSLSACNESLVRATDEPSLLNQICDLVVNVGGYRMAWVGYAGHDEGKTIRVAAASGFEAGYLDTANATWADEERGHGPTGTAIRTGEATACRDMTSDPCFVPWREDALKRGYRSSLALPLKSGEEVLGALTIYATETGVFDAAEQRLLEELCNNLSYGIVALRARAERKRAEEALQESERRYRLLFNEMVVGFALIEPIYDENGKPCDFLYLEVNPAFETHSGLPRDRVLGKTLREVLPTLDPFWFETYGKVATTGESIHFERYAPPLGKWLELIAFRTHQGQVAVTFDDITKRKQVEDALRQSEERFRVALKNSPIAVYSLDRDLRYTWIYNSHLPQPVSEHLGKTAGDLFDPEGAARLMEVRRRVLETGVGVHDEAQVTFGGRKHYFDTTIEPVLDAAGAVIGLTGASTDVTTLRETTEALREAQKKLTEEKLYLEQEIDTALGFGEIIGQSKALQDVMEQVGKVAASDATVLLLGETGTGKELVARAIHRLSRRSNSSFIKMNCAAIPTGLLESELFGNEKGAFTGAVSKKIGRIELADKGTLFLDEIGEIALALQPKLLRVLQDQEFERLGGTQTLKVDFRLIAATNRDIAERVREKEFRSDLYYRLNVFPVRVPPLRERRDDIRLLVEHFVQKFARRMNRAITSIPRKTMDALMGWEWPGNVRELENFIERSVILTQGSVLVSPLSELKPARAAAEKKDKDVDESLEAAEREHILRALQESHGQIGGPKGAAMRLGLKRTTLQSKLKHFGINPRTGPPSGGSSQVA